MPEGFIPVWMSVGEAQNMLRSLDPEDEHGYGVIESALEDERPRTYLEMEAERKFPAESSGNPEPAVAGREAIDHLRDLAGDVARLNERIHRQPCSTCGGTGKRRRQFGPVGYYVSCGRCHGTGTVPTDKQEASDG